MEDGTLLTRLALMITVLTFGGAVAFGGDGADAGSFVTPNEFSGTDIERINRAVAMAAQTHRRVVVPRLNHAADGDREIWLLDAAILVPSNTVLELDNCHIKLSDRCRDNIIRSANCGIGITDIPPVHDVTIRGFGNVILEGADRPRATGDSAKTLGKDTYGSDAGLMGQSQTGDWRNIGILLAFVDHFSIENLRLKDPHCWSISLERCTRGRIANIDFEMTGTKQVDGKLWRVLNQDGIDLRQGCQRITIENISGVTGDDVIALTDIAGSRPAGSDRSTMVSGSQSRPEGLDDIRDIIIRNVRGFAAGGHHVIRLLNTGGLRIQNVIIDGVIDTSPAERPCRATIKIGDSNPRWGGVTPLGDTSHILINNVISSSEHTLLIAGSLTDSAISNVVRIRPGGSVITLESGREMVRNVQFQNLIEQTTAEPSQ
jgi:hypothetical protein